MQLLNSFSSVLGKPRPSGKCCRCRLKGMSHFSKNRYSTTVLLVSEHHSLPAALIWKAGRCHTSCPSQRRGTHPSCCEYQQCLCSLSSGSLCHACQVTASPVSHLRLLVPACPSSYEMFYLKCSHVVSGCGF